MGNALNFRHPYDQQGEEVSALGDVENSDVSNNNSAEDQNSSRDEEQGTANGVYFGNHFIVGSQRILTTDAESILFGGLSSVTGQRPSFRPSRVHVAPTVKSAINLHKESLKLIRTENDSKEFYQIQFQFDTLEDCNIKIRLSTGPEEQSDWCSVVYPRGLNQTFIVPIEKALDLSLYEEASLIYQPEIGVYPISITLEVVKDKREKAAEVCETSQEQPLMIESQTTLATFSRAGVDSSYDIKPLKVTIQYGGAVYLVHDLYGSDATAGGETDSGRECVICMSDPRDITVWPCNHLCLCSACAELFRFQTDKCPICRSSVKALLKMADVKKFNSTSSSTDDAATLDEESDTPLTLNNRKEIMV